MTVLDHHPAADGSDADTSVPPPDVVRVLVENHRQFLGFLEKRVGSRAQAEDSLQDAFVRGLDKAGSIRDGEAATAWFYRLLRNAIVDHARRRGAESRALERAAVEPELLSPTDDRELMDTVCGCVTSLLDTLKPEYADALRHVDLHGAAVHEWADTAGITANNAAVRLHRARQALRRQVERTCGTCATHGCFDCHCGEAPGHCA